MPETHIGYKFQIMSSIKETKYKNTNLSLAQEE